MRLSCTDADCLISLVPVSHVWFRFHDPVSVPRFAFGLSGLLQWEAAMRDYQQGWACCLANMYALRPDCGELDSSTFGVSCPPADIQQSAAFKADLRTVEQNISPEQEGVLLWFLQTANIPRASSFVSGKAKCKQWLQLAKLDACYKMAVTVRKGRVERFEGLPCCRG